MGLYPSMLATVQSVEARNTNPSHVILCHAPDNPVDPTLIGSNDQRDLCSNKALGMYQEGGRVA